jgi:hypothetical protein
MVNLAVGDCIKVKTKTLNDVFGECIYQVQEVGVLCPHCKKDDGIRFVMLGGSGPSARVGYPITDCPQRIQQNIAQGITVVMDPAKAKVAAEFYCNKSHQARRTQIEM